MRNLFVIVRKDLKVPEHLSEKGMTLPGYISVQAGHAVGEFMKKYPGLWENNYLYYFQANDREALIELLDLANNKGTAIGFIEPDHDDEYTAIAFASNMTYGFMNRVEVLVL